MQRFLLLMTLLALSFPALVSCSCIENKIAVISLNGVIQEESQLSLFGGSAITPHDVRRDLQRAQNDSTVKAIVMQVNTPELQQDVLRDDRAATEVVAPPEGCGVVQVRRVQQGHVIRRVGKDGFHFRFGSPYK